MEYLIVIILLIITIILGYFLLKSLNFIDEVSLIEALPLAFGLGVGIISFFMFILTLFKIKWYITILTILSLIFPIFLMVISFKKSRKISNFSLSLKPRDKLLIFLSFITIAFVIFEALLRPLYAWDGWSTWLFMSKIFYLENGMPSFGYQYINTDYPFMISNFISYIYYFLGSVNDNAVLLVFAVYYVMLGIIFFFELSKKLGTTFSLLFTFLLIISPNLVRHGGRFEAGHVDLPLAFYFFVSMSLLVSFFKKSKISTFILLQLFLVILSLVKNEGVPFAVFIDIMAVALILKKNLYKYLQFLLVYLIPILLWQYYKVINNVPANNYFVNASIHLDRGFIILNGILAEFINISRWNFLWIFFVLFFLLSIFTKKDQSQNLWIISILWQLGVYFFIFLITPTNVTEHIKIIDRLLLHLSPLAVYFIAVEFNKIIKSNEKI